MARSLMLTGHSLEKGMSFEHKRRGWGKEKAKSLCATIRKAKNMYGITPELVSAVNILRAYRDDEDACKESALIKEMDTLLVANQALLEDNRAGVKDVCPPERFDEQEIKRFYETRCSVRDFSEVPLTNDEVNQAMDLAYMTPSACNRQSSKVYAIRDKDKIREILNLQLGDQGWCDKATILFVITGQLSQFGGVNERYQVYIDGGMYAMNFVMGLHLNGIASCYKMFIRNHKSQRAIGRICKIPSNEVPIVFVLAGHYKNSPVKDPVSFRIKKGVEFVN